MKVLHHTLKYFPSSETFVHDVITNAQKEGIAASVFAHKILKHTDGLDTHDISSPFKNKQLLRLSNAVHRFFGLAHNTNYKTAANLLRQTNPDLIHCHFGPAAYLNQSLQKYTKMKVPTLVSLHGYDVFEHENLSHNYANVLKNIAAREDTLFTVPSDYLKRLAMQILSIPEQKLRVVYNGFNSKLFIPSYLKFNKGDTFIISHIGRFIDWKGQQNSIRAAALLVKAGIKDIQFQFIGSGDTLDECKQLAAELGVSDKCHFLGALPHQKVADVIRNSHLYVHTSVSIDKGQTETFGVAALEAAAMGKPVVYFESGGVPELFSGQNPDFYVNVAERDVEGLTGAIARLYSEASNMDFAVLAQEREKIVRRFNDKKCLQELLRIYTQLSGVEFARHSSAA